MSIEEIKEEITHCDYCIHRIQQNMLGKLLANSADSLFLQEYIERKEALTKKLEQLTHQHEDKGE